MMLSWIVRRIVESAYKKVNAFDLGGLTRMFAPDAVFGFQGPGECGPCVCACARRTRTNEAAASSFVGAGSTSIVR